MQNLKYTVMSYCKTLRSILINIPIKLGVSFRKGGHLKVYVLRSKKSACFSNIGKISSLSNTLVAIKSCIGNWKRSMWVEKKCAYYFSLTTAATRARSCRSSRSAVLPSSCCSTSSAHLYAVAQREEGRQRWAAPDAPQFDLPIWLIPRREVELFMLTSKICQLPLLPNRHKITKTLHCLLSR